VGSATLPPSARAAAAEEARPAPSWLSPPAADDRRGRGDKTRPAATAATAAPTPVVVVALAADAPPAARVADVAATFAARAAVGSDARAVVVVVVVVVGAGSVDAAVSATFALLPHRRHGEEHQRRVVELGVFFLKTFPLMSI